MSLFKSWKSDGAVFAIWKVEETDGELRAMLGDSLPYDAELSALRAESRRTEYLAVRVLLKALCGEEKQVDLFLFHDLLLFFRCPPVKWSSYSLKGRNPDSYGR